MKVKINWTTTNPRVGPSQHNAHVVCNGHGILMGTYGYDYAQRNKYKAMVARGYEHITKKFNTSEQAREWVEYEIQTIFSSIQTEE